jgi:hypothetical protein
MTSHLSPSSPRLLNGDGGELLWADQCGDGKTSGGGDAWFLDDPYLADLGVKTVGQVYTFLGCRSLASVRRTLHLELGTKLGMTRVGSNQTNEQTNKGRGHAWPTVQRGGARASSFLHNNDE